MIRKHHRLKFAIVATISKHILNLVHFDAWKSSVLSLVGEKIFFTFINDYFWRL